MGASKCGMSTLFVSYTHESCSFSTFYYVAVVTHVTQHDVLYELCKVTSVTKQRDSAPLAYCCLACTILLEDIQRRMLSGKHHVDSCLRRFCRDSPPNKTNESTGFFSNLWVSRIFEYEIPRCLC